MLEHKIGGLAVVDEEGHLTGIITESDIFRALGSILTSEPASRIILEVESVDKNKAVDFTGLCTTKPWYGSSGPPTAP